MTGAAPDPPLDIAVTLSLGSLALRVELRTRQRAVAIVGPSGAGKSTLLRILAGVERRAVGRVAMAGRVWLDSAKGFFLEPWERHVGWVPQDDLLFPHLTVRQNLAFAGAHAGEVEETAEMLSVRPLLDRRPRNLSGGERQRVAPRQSPVGETRTAPTGRAVLRPRSTAPTGPRGAGAGPR